MLGQVLTKMHFGEQFLLQRGEIINIMKEHQESKDQNLRLYIAYEDYLSTEQLSSILSALDNLYNHLYIGFDPDLPFPLPLETRMRIKEIHTGQSIELLIMEGIRQIWDAGGPTMLVLGSTGILAGMARLIIGIAKNFAEIRELWYKGSQEKEEAKQAKLESERLRREIEHAQDRKGGDIIFDLSEIPNDQRQHALQAILEFMDLIEYSSNIRRVRVNEVVILNKRSSGQ